MAKIMGKPNGKAYRVKGVSDRVWGDDYARTDTRQALKRELDIELDDLLELSWEAIEVYGETIRTLESTRPKAVVTVTDRTGGASPW